MHRFFTSELAIKLRNQTVSVPDCSVTKLLFLSQNFCFCHKLYINCPSPLVPAVTVEWSGTLVRNSRVPPRGTPRQLLRDPQKLSRPPVLTKLQRQPLGGQSNHQYLTKQTYKEIRQSFTWFYRFISLIASWATTVQQNYMGTSIYHIYPTTWFPTHS